MDGYISFVNTLIFSWKSSSFFFFLLYKIGIYIFLLNKSQIPRMKTGNWEIRPMVMLSAEPCRGFERESHREGSIKPIN
ncbi:hypothetical protein BDZ91DRAFT_725934 [Kalaharituber pfeilii]|nr:hypothetical protein BDZ91DRAFT_725934 [Kalaharituber pfeilii]